MRSLIASFEHISSSLPQSLHNPVSDASPVTVLSYCNTKPLHNFFSEQSPFQDAPLALPCSLPTTQPLAETISMETEAPSIFDMFEIQLQDIASVYSLRNAENVIIFLKKHLFLTSLLIEAKSYIDKYFSNSATFLDVETDPEEPNGQQLVALVETDASPEEAYRKLKQFNEDWWLKVIASAQMKLCISVEFK